MTISRRAVRRRRLTAAACAATILIAGLLVHSLGTGTAADIAGDALFAAFVYLLLVVLLPRSFRTTVAALAILLCGGIELLQLTDIPAQASAVFPPAALVLGNQFDQRDLFVYAVTGLAVMGVDVVVSRRLRSRSRR